MIALFTDYGLSGPYLGQVQAVLHKSAPGIKVIYLLADAPRNNPRASAYLLASLIHSLPDGTVCFSVVDPGVGSFTDESVILKVDEYWFVGPDNGLFDMVARWARKVECWRITWRPESLSASFHGRDLYAPVCAKLALGEEPPGEPVSWQDRHGWPDDLEEIIYIDHFGNVMTGLRSARIEPASELRFRQRIIRHAETFASVRSGEYFWYGNSNGLVEIAANQDSAAGILGIRIGDKIQLG